MARTVKTIKTFLLLTILGCPWASAQQRVLIRGGTLIDPAAGTLLPESSILVEGDRVLSVSSQEVPAGAGMQVVDARGKYVLPGLIDLHIHYKDWSAELYLNHGVTTVVDLSGTGASEWIVAQSRGIEEGWIPGPRLLYGLALRGPSLEQATLDSLPLERVYLRQVGGSGGRQQGGLRPTGSHVVDNAEEVRQAMGLYARHPNGIAAVKVFQNLGPETLRAIVEEAGRMGIPVLGHFLDVRLAAQVGAAGVEHTWGVATAILDQKLRQETLRKVHPGFIPPAEAFVDRDQIPEIARLMVQSGLYLNPTLRMSWQGDRALREKGFHFEEFDLLFNDWRLRYVPLSFRLAAIKELQEIDLWHWADLPRLDQDLFHQAYLNSQRIVKAFSDLGGRLYAGTDSANLCTPGLSLHQELELLVDAGVSPLQALQAATTHPAHLLGRAHRLGSVRAGTAADLIILDANPLEDIRNTRRIRGVLSRGRLLDGRYHADFENPLPRNSWESSSHYFPSPRIRSLSPAALQEGTAGHLTIRGTGFIPYSLVRFDRRKVPTVFVDEFQLKAEVPAELVRAGTHAVAVENPDFGWGTTYGAADLAHLGIRPPLSNEFRVLVERD